MTPIVDQFFEVGIDWMVSLSTTWRRTTLVVSTIGASPLTVMVSSSAPTRMSTFSGAVNDAVSSIPSRRTVEKPVSVKVTA